MIIALLAVFALPLAWIVAVAGPAQGATPTATYTKTSDWGTGFEGRWTISNTGDQALSGWTLEWDFPSGTVVTSAWDARVTNSGTHWTARDAGWNGTLAPGQTASFGFNGSYSGTNALPTTFTLDGVTCNVDGGGGPTDPGGPSNPGPGTGTRVDNPYTGAKVYVNPEWSANAAAEPGGSRVSSQPTGVWLDRIAAISGTGGRMGLRAHLDATRPDAPEDTTWTPDEPGRTTTG